MANYNSVTLARTVQPSDTSIALLSGSGINKGDFIFVVDMAGRGEFMPIRTVGGVTVLGTNPPTIQVVRTGIAATHGPNSLAYTGPPSAFYTVDPYGVPPTGVQPYWINVKTGDLWVAQGDEQGPGSLTRFWQKQIITPGRGSLGIRTFTPTPTQAVQ